MIIKNGLVFGADCKFGLGEIAVQESRIAQTCNDTETFDATDCYVVPGFVDIHIHGAAGSDFCDGGIQHLNTIAGYLAKQGVTSFLGTSMAFDEPILTNLFTIAKEIIGKDISNQAVMRGINMEGPFFSKAKKGAQSEKYIVPPALEMFKRLYEVSGEAVRLVDVAPEEPNALDFIKEASKLCTVSIAHTTADFETASAAFEAGATHVTHLFNAMPNFSHRAPGVVGAAGDYASHVEMICDGIHLHPSIIRNMFRMFGPQRICLISDSMQACGMPNGEYSLGGQKVFVQDGKATLADGTIAGSSTCQPECMRRAVSFGVSLEDAITAATVNPAKAIGLFDEIGSLEIGKRADLVVLNKALQPVLVLIGGKKVAL
ncbi:MAG: N-acetylglucosamine-6-phosphate deacetylase [Oscillospiraceae bacterium]|nr:N-acetylglucosamine-6-phosphate deacetylase [Oscillospiraceae bacterium]